MSYSLYTPPGDEYGERAAGVSRHRGRVSQGNGGSHVAEPQSAWGMPGVGRLRGQEMAGGVVGGGQEYEMPLMSPGQRYQDRLSPQHGPSPSPSPGDSSVELIKHSPYDAYSYPPIDHPIPPSRLHSQKNPKRWKFFAFTALTLLVLIINTLFTAIASIKYGLDSGIGTFYSGSCEYAKRSSAWIHLAINILGTLLLAASGYGMQSLCAPTREDVDRVHRRGGWLDIGVPSFRNLRKLGGRGRRWLWWGLVVSSAPLHLLYNSAIVDTLAANEYMVVVVAESFLSGASWKVPFADTTDAITGIQKLASNTSSGWEKLDPADCITSYSDQFMLKRRDVVVVVSTDPPTPENSVLGYLGWTYGDQMNSWICGTNTSDSMILTTLPIDSFDCQPDTALVEAASWAMADQSVRYCLSELVPERCKLQFSLHIMVVVIFCNLVKLACLMMVGRWIGSRKTLATLGDAVESFLENPDVVTGGMCLLSMKEVVGGGWRGEEMAGQRIWRPKREFWFRVSQKSWVACNTLSISALALTCGLFALGLHNLTTSEDLSTLRGLGFGQINSAALIPLGDKPLLGASGLLATATIANIPQAFLSVWYLTFNGALTSMLVGNEWSQFADRSGKGRPLRVSVPRGGLQVRTYLLSLPWGYAAPVLGLSSVLHWLASQSIFPARIEAFNRQGAEDFGGSIATCGYSPIAIIITMAILGLISISAIAIGLRRFGGGNPVVGSCSVAISAGCHPPEGEQDVAFGLLRWGVVGRDDPVGHCSLSSGRVTAPVPGQWYH